ncbi:MAG: sulfur oxidation c-type cytochrome SoxA [Sulfuricella sp.]
MKQIITALVACMLCAINIGAVAGPEKDRKAVLEHHKKNLPNVRFEDYVYGALALNPDAKAQYDEIMSFPPYLNDMDTAKAMWEKPFGNGKTFASCFPNGGKNVAGGYPYFDNEAGKVVTFENALNACLKKNGEPELKYGSHELTLLSAHAKSLSDGMKVKVEVKGAGALAAYEKGKTLYYSRRGQFNFSCAVCHINYAGKFLRSEQLSPLVGQAAHWPEFRAGTDATSLQQRFKQCQKNTRGVPSELNSEEYNNLEYFITYMSNGLPMQTPVFRK